MVADGTSDLAQGKSVFGETSMFWERTRSIQNRHTQTGLSEWVV